MVGALILEPGIVARTPDETTSLATTTAGLGVPGTQSYRLERILGLDGAAASELGPVPGTSAYLTVLLRAFMRAQTTDPAAFIEWMSRYVALAQVIADQTALASAGDNTALDSLRPGPRIDASAPTSPAPAPHHPAPKPAPRPTQNRHPPANYGNGPDGIWNVAPIVTWYGPGFYGNRTACGLRYTRTIIGVAHRTLPCGTLIEFRWHGMTAVAPVIDRGPYASAAYVFDWSAALACHVFKPRGVSNSCFTRHDVQWRIVGRRKL